MIYLIFMLLTISSCRNDTIFLVDRTKTEIVETVVEKEVLKVIDPCGDDIDNYDEIILFTTDGKYLSYFKDGDKEYLTELNVGKYITTDKQKCYFEILDDNTIVWEE